MPSPGIRAGRGSGQSRSSRLSRARGNKGANDLSHAADHADGVAPPVAPAGRLSIAVTGHRAAHASFVGREAAVEAALLDIFALLDEAVARSPKAAGATRIHTLLADGTDMLAAEAALARGWELVAPLPFGPALNRAINAAPTSIADAEALLAERAPADATVGARASAMADIAERAKVFALADRDAHIARLFRDHLARPDDPVAANLLSAESARRVALAGRILVEQSDLMIAVWDGATSALVGGTGHTVEAALEAGAPVVWIDPATAPAWRILRAPEALAGLDRDAPHNEADKLRAIVAEVLNPHETARDPLADERWFDSSHRLAHAYRRVEAVFSGEPGRLRGLTQRYERPELIATGSFAWVRSALTDLSSTDPAFDPAMTREVLHRFAWTDAISARLSDKYRGGMIVNFILSSFAIVGGLAYLPFVGPDMKWPFAAFELVLLLAIVAITIVGTRRRWHGRWFETRRVAEYLRHAPIMLALGAARAPGRWPRSTDTGWPEWHARQALRTVGLPRMILTSGFLRTALVDLLGRHVGGQMAYHRAKAKRLANVHHNLDRLSEALFLLAIASVAGFIAMWIGAELGLVSSALIERIAKPFTLLGVLFPTFGAGIAGIRYFGDFERFSAISEVTAEKLEAVHARIELLADAGDEALDYGRVVELVHAADDIVVAEIENWQAVFGGKHITVPV